MVDHVETLEIQRVLAITHHAFHRVSMHFYEMKCGNRRRPHPQRIYAFSGHIGHTPLPWRSGVSSNQTSVCKAENPSNSQNDKDKPQASRLRPSPANLISEEDWLVRSRIRRSPDIIKHTKVAVCGGGSFGTAMANLLARNGYPVSVLVRKPWVCEEINEEHRNPKYLSEYMLPDNLSATIDPEEAFRDAKLCVHAVPVQATREFIESIQNRIPDDLPILCTSKGLEISSLSLMCELLPRMLGTNRKYAYLSGPSFAAEIMRGLPTAVVVASSDRLFANSLADMFSSPSFKVFTSTDTVGLEVAGAIKNVIAIAAGMSEGLGLGTNSMAALVTRGCSEMRRIAIGQGASPVTLAGLSGVGDTFLTCFGPLSRNRTVGVRLGKGEKLEDILNTSRQTAEGVATAKALVRWLGGGEENSPMDVRASLKYPILYGVAAILDGKMTPREGLHMLLAMPPRQED
ncbi:Glycerol-3-phosphate dehydrogenase [Gracilaria domingensis]|nr:Glycerol-3-phosphate dehydrogenase [Gracilaria domingensis]